MAEVKKTYRKFLLLAVPAAGVLLFSGALKAHGPGHNPTRYHVITKQGFPSGYAGLVNPLPLSADNLAAGKKLYTDNCASCHGAEGDGHGEGGRGLKPPPAKLTGMYARPMRGMGRMGPTSHMMHGVAHHHPGMTHAEAMGGLNLDAYNFWAISDGGEKLGSAMPAFKDTLSRKERWQVLLYVANQFGVKAKN